MTKTKRKQIPGPAMECTPQRIGTRTLVACPNCKGFGAAMLDDGSWRSCEKCGGGGRTYADAGGTDVPSKD